MKSQNSSPQTNKQKNQGKTRLQQDEIKTDCSVFALKVKPQKLSKATFQAPSRARPNTKST